MSVILNICGMLISASHFPDATLQSFYQQYYHCQIERSAYETSTQIQSASSVSQLFPQTSTWWPIFTVDQLQSASFKNLIQNDIKPGIILPNEYFSIVDYYKIKKAVSQGAIPIAVYQMKYSKYFAAKATFSTAIGLRPLAAIVETGWDENLIAQPAGNYIIQSDDSNELNVPARMIQHRQQYFYQATTDVTQNSGYQIIVNPPVDISLNHIAYPHLGISWKLNHINYQSTTDGVETNIIGYIMMAISTVIIPLDYILSAPYPSLLSTFGSSISWISLLLGCGLLLILIISIIRRRRINARN